MAALESFKCCRVTALQPTARRYAAALFMLATCHTWVGLRNMSVLGYVSARAFSPVLRHALPAHARKLQDGILFQPSGYKRISMDLYVPITSENRGGGVTLSCVNHTPTLTTCCDPQTQPNAVRTLPESAWDF